MGADCARAPLRVDCQELPAGALVLTEIRGDQTGISLRGEWLEVFNASGDPVDLSGLRVEVTRLDSGEVTGMDFVRDPSLALAAGEYLVLGLPDAAGAPPPDADYTFTAAIGAGLPNAAILQLYDCGGNIVDRVIMRSTPSVGTRSLDGANPPNAEANEDTDSDAWCDDETEVDIPNTDMETEGPGTPGEANIVCP